jgi:transcriptional regulator PpsR
VKAFKAPKDTLGDLTAETAANLVAAAADIALIIDGDGVIQDVAFRQTDLSLELERYSTWFGRPWTETVTAESQPKIDALLREAATKPASRWRQLNHQAARGNDIPVLYSAVEIRKNERFVALGRDLRAVAALQQKVVEAQITMERDYARMRHVETRYRLLFQLSAEAVLILDVTSHKVLEANPAALLLFSENPKRVIGRAFPEGFDTESTHRLQTLLTDVRSAGRGDGVRARLAGTGKEFFVTASLFRQDVTSMLLIRLLPASGDGSAAISEARFKLLALSEKAPDGLIVTNRDGRILAANQAFVDMAQLASEEQGRGEMLERWFGRPEIDFQVLMSNLRQNDAIRLFATILRGEYGATADIEVSAVRLPDGTKENYGFVIRNVGRRLSAPRAERELPRSAEQLTDLIGRVPLKDIVRETTDVIERMCIEAALNLTGDNRASAAEMLGLSRQSLYVKLRRLGRAELPDEPDSQAP